MTSSAYEQAVSAYVSTHLVRATDAGVDDSCAWFRTGAPNEELNAVLRLRGRRDDIDETVAEGRRRLAGARGLWHVWPGLDPHWLGDGLTRRGLRLCETEPLMLAAGGPAAQAHDPGRGRARGTAREVTDERQLASWARLWSGVSEEGMIRALCEGLRQAGDLGRTRYLLWHEGDGQRDDDPVACAAVVSADQDAAIEHVVTRRDRRRHGIGGALTAHALALARAAGSSRIVLTASPEGEGLYGRLGFEPVGEVQRYRPQRNE